LHFSGEQDGYVAEAVDAAKAEVARRHLSSLDISQTMADVQEEELVDRMKFQQPLSNRAWIAFVIFGPTTFSFIFAILLGVRGYGRKCKEAFLAIFTGFAAWSMLFAILGILFQLGWIH
jgi:hypothetical protein